MGSGHILSYAFDVMIRIYEKSGVSRRDAAKSIVENNLYGLDIDERASQLAYFAVMMKGCQYDRRFLSRGAQPKVYAIPESNELDNETIAYFINSDPKLQKDFGTIVKEFRDAKEYGSILNISPADFDLLYARVEEVKNDISLYHQNVLEQILPLIQAAEVMSAKYDVVVTNPPYMGVSGMGAKLSEFVKKNYPDSKSDLFACFMTKGNRMIRQNRYNSMVTMQSWMFLSSFEKMRTDIIKKLDIVALMHMENMVMHIAFGTAVAIFRDSHIDEYKGTYNQIKLKDLKDDMPIEFPIKENRFSQVCTDNFSKIPGSPVAYWVGEKILDIFTKGESINNISDFTGSQHITANNNMYLRYCWEIESSKIGKGKSWAFYAKGGEYRKWYGNIEWLVKCDPDAIRFYRTNLTSNCLDEKYWFTEGITYSAVTSRGTGFRYYPSIGAFDKGGATICYIENLKYVLALLNTKIARYVFDILNPTINLQVKDVSSLPILFSKPWEDDIHSICSEEIHISKADWDSYETSWDFKKHPMV